MLNAEVGTIRLVGPNIAEYRSAGGFMVRLARFPGAKRFQLCD